MLNVELLNTLPRLASMGAYRTNDLDAARSHISSLFVPHHLDVIGQHQVMDVCVGRADINGVSLLYHRHGASVRVVPQLLRDFFLLQIPIRGEAIVKVGHQEVYCNPTQAVMISPMMGVDMRFGQGCEQLIVRIEKSDIERHLEQQLGRNIGLPLEFSPAVPLSTTGAQEITSLLKLMAVSVMDGEGICSSAIGRTNLVSLLLSGLLSCLDHNYRDELSRGVGRPRPAYIAKAQNYMRQNLAQPITPEDVAEAVHVSTRALYAGFKLYLNTTPMRYLKELRLDAVRDALANNEGQDISVTTIAMDCGFYHLGHFCAAYKERFGELPRETLHKFVC